MKNERTYRYAAFSLDGEESRVFVIRSDNNVTMRADSVEVKNALKKEKKRLKLQNKLEKLKEKEKKCPHVVCIEEEGWMYTARICISCGAFVDEL